MFLLETPRLILRDLLPQDAAPMHLLRSDPVVTRYCDYIASETPEQAETWVRDTMVHNAAEPRLSYNLAIVRRSDGCIMGWIGIGQANDPALGELSFGYAMRPDFWGQGYMTEALTALLGCAFRQWGAQSVQGECDAANPASARVMEKAGLRFIKRTPEEDGSESLWYAATAAEWQARAAKRDV
jgi:RimJ/RimL family protein N-acetyltransferase